MAVSESPAITSAARVPLHSNPGNRRRLAGKSVIVTGGGMGMGREIALRLASEGGSVSVFDIDAGAGAATVALVQTAGGNAIFMRCDLTDAASVQAAVAAHVAQWGGVDVLVNNAGIMHSADDLIEDTPEAAWEASFGVNLNGPFHTCHYALLHMLAAGGGVIVNSASNAGTVGTTRPLYGTSKAAAISLTLEIARQYGDRNIRANVVLPGAFATPMLDTVRHYAIKVARPRYRPLERIGQAHEITGMIAFLACDDSQSINGAIFPVDGGSTAV